MAVNILYIADRTPSVSATLSDGTGAAINLTGFTVQFALKRDFAVSNLFKSAAVVVTPASGTVRYDFATNDLATAVAGRYWGQWIVTDGGGKVEHIDAGEFELRRAA